MLLLMSCVAPDPKSDTGTAPGLAPVPAEDTHEYSSYSGEIHWSWGFGTRPGDHLCELVWETVATSTTRCADCTWAFDVDFTYQEERSHDGGDCLTSLDSPDFTWSMGLIEGYGGYGVDAVSVYYAAYSWWAPTWTADWSSPNIRFGGGYLDDPYVYADQGYYYTNYWYGTAVVE